MRPEGEKMLHDTPKVNFNGKKMIAHRGVSGLEAENTLAAFIAAGNRSYYGIECDIHRTADGQYVVIHDSETGRVAGDDVTVEKCSFDLVRNVKLNDKDGSKRKDLFIPTYREYLKICKRYKKVSIVEFKGVFEKEWIEDAVKITQEEAQLENTIFIAFDAINLIRLREILPAQSAQFLAGEWNDDLPGFLQKNKLDLDIYHIHLTAERIAKLHEKGITVNCWTVDDKADAEKLFEAGVDFITSNILE